MHPCMQISPNKQDAWISPNMQLLLQAGMQRQMPARSVRAAHLQNGVIQQGEGLSILGGVRQLEEGVRLHKGVHDHVLHCICLPARLPFSVECSNSRRVCCHSCWHFGRYRAATCLRIPSTRLSCPGCIALGSQLSRVDASSFSSQMCWLRHSEQCSCSLVEVHGPEHARPCAEDLKDVVIL